jgi:hypothetical protein
VHFEDYMGILDNVNDPHRNTTTPEGKGGRPRKFDLEWLKRGAYLSGNEGYKFKYAFKGLHRSNLWRWAHADPRVKRLLIATREHYSQWRLDHTKEIRNNRRRWRSRQMPEYKYQLCFCDRVLPTVTATAVALGVSRSTIYAWRKRHPEFNMAIIRAMVAFRLPLLTEKMRMTKRLVERLERKKATKT